MQIFAEMNKYFSYLRLIVQLFNFWVHLSIFGHEPELATLVQSQILLTGRTSTAEGWQQWLSNRDLSQSSGAAHPRTENELSADIWAENFCRTLSYAYSRTIILSSEPHYETFISHEQQRSSLIFPFSFREVLWFWLWQKGYYMVIRWNGRWTKGSSNLLLWIEYQSSLNDSITPKINVN